jgi:outer membrane lipoprotein-sorting protein
MSRPYISIAITFAAVGAAAFIAHSTAPSLNAADDTLQRSRAMYGELRSYADTGVVVYEYGSSTKDRHTFTTYFNRTPRRFYLDFNKQGGDRYAIWGDADAFHTWWKATGQQFDYPNPDNMPALNGSGRNTSGAGLKIPTLLYSKAALLSDFANFTDAVTDGSEDISGRRCHRVLGTTRDVYGATGKEVNVRKMTVWIDAESLLIRKVVEQWKALPGEISRMTTTFEPQANPTLDESRFRFSPPAPK